MLPEILLAKTLETSRPGVLLQRATLCDAYRLFKLIDCNRQHLSSFGNGAANFPDQYSLELDLIYPKPSGRSRFLILNQGLLSGNICLIPQQNNLGRAELAAWIAKNFTRNGLATLATQTLAQHAINAGYDEVFARTRKDNVPGHWTLTQSGFEQVPGQGNYDLFIYRPTTK